VLTKPLGTGSLTTALKNDALSMSDIAEAIEGMRQTNRAGVEPCRGAGVRAATDVSGFGLIGHAAEMARASSVEVIIESSLVPAYPLAREMLNDGHLTRGDGTNLDYARILGPVEGEIDALLLNPQTSGGLLVGVPASACSGLVEALRRAGYRHTVRVGRVGEGAGVRVVERLDSPETSGSIV
jgi:selenide,water dikinase